MSSSSSSSTKRARGEAHAPQPSRGGASGTARESSTTRAALPPVSLLTSSDSDDEADDTSSAKDDATHLTSASSAAARSRSSAKALEDLYEACETDELKRPGGRYTCKTCRDRGVALSDCQGSRRHLFCLTHSTEVHADDEAHRNAVAQFPRRQSKKKARAAEHEAAARAQSAPRSTPVNTLHNYKFEPAPRVTRDDVLAALGKFMVTEELAMSKIDSLQDVVNTLVTYGSQTGGVMLTLPNHQTFVKDVIEGEDGILGKNVSMLLDSDKAFMKSVKDSGIVVSFDGARDINLRQLVPILATVPGSRTLLAVPRSTNKTASWIHGTLASVVDGSYDVASQETYRTTNPARKPSASGAAERMSLLVRQLGKYVFMVSSDHASAEQSALTQLEATHAVLACGDPCHAVHNTAKRLMQPFAEEIRLCHDVVVFFRAHTVFREQLRERVGGSFATLVLDVETRFLSTLYMIKSVLRAKTELLDITALSSFQTWRSNNPDHADTALTVKQTIANEGVMLKLELAHNMLVPLLKMCRFFDASRPGSLAFVHPMFNSLTESVLLTMADSKFRSIVTPTLVNNVKDTLVDSWERFDFDVYDAAYLCHHAFVKDIYALNTAPSSSSATTSGTGTLASDESARSNEYFDLQEKFMRVVRIMIRRFPPALEAPARDVILKDDDPEVIRIAESVKCELDAWMESVRKEPRFTYRSDLPERTSGVLWRRSRFLNARAYCARLVDACVGSADVERLHALQGRIRTKKRNRLGYVRSQALAFLNMQLKLEAAPRPVGEWGFGLELLQDFMKLSDEDERYLDEFEQHLDRRQAADSGESATEEEGHEGAGDAASAGDEDDPDDDPDDERVEPARRGRRQASSRFYAVLREERRIQDDGGS